MKKIKCFFLFALSFVFCFMIAEGVLRLNPCFFSIHICYKEYSIIDKEIHHKFIPNSKGISITPEHITIIEINNLGMRDKPFFHSNNYTILMLGDSFIFGVGVNYTETIPTTLERLFQEENKSVEIWNGGVSSYSPILEYIYIKKYLNSIAPDMIILSFDLGDIQDDYTYEKNAKFSQTGEIIAVNGYGDRLAKKINRWFLTHSYMFSLFSKIIVAENTKTMSSDDIGDIESDKLFFMRVNSTNSERELHYNRTFTYIKKINELTRERNISFILVIYPYGNLVNEREWKEGRKFYLLDTYPIEPDIFFKYVETFAEENKIQYINLYENFTKTNEYPLYYNMDFHFTQKGTKVFAEAIFPIILKNWQ